MPVDDPERASVSYQATSGFSDPHDSQSSPGETRPTTVGAVPPAIFALGSHMTGDRLLRHTVRMPVEAWWPKLSPATREWLIANNGDVVPFHIVDEIAQAGGPATFEVWWVSQDDSTGLCMPDEAIDWIEEIANEESPPSGRQ